MQSYRQSPLANIPPVVKNLIIINALFFVGKLVLGGIGINLTDLCALHYPGSSLFNPFQLITHLFMHGDITHIFFNMFALYMFGRILEQVWGPKRFLVYYFATGLGAAALHLFVNHLEIQGMLNAVEAFNNTPAPELFDQFVSKNVPNARPWVYDLVNSFYDNPTSARIQDEASQVMSTIVTRYIDIPTVGASGAVYGVLLAFGMLFPNTELMLLFPPIPIKAKYFVIGYGIIELVLGFTQAHSNVAHFAHLGGMIFGFLLIKYWNKQTNHFY